MRQHIDSYNHFIDVGIKQIVMAKSNREVRDLDYCSILLLSYYISSGAFDLLLLCFMKTLALHNTNHHTNNNPSIKFQPEINKSTQVRSDADPKFFLQYTNIYVGKPSLHEDHFDTKTVTPFQCRLRDTTYSAPLYVDIRYVRQNCIVNKKGIEIGRIPIMLRSNK